MINELTVKDSLLGAKGRLLHTGWSRVELLSFDRTALPSLRRLVRLKEWDSYFIGREDIQVLLTAADFGYAGYVSATVVNPLRGSEKTIERITPFSLGSMDMPQTSGFGDVIYRSKALSLDFGRAPESRYVRFHAGRFDDVRSLYINVVFSQPPEDSFYLAEGFDGRLDCFCLTHLLGCMPVSGTVVYGADTYSLDPATATGALTWGRAVLPSNYSRTWLQAGGRTGEGLRIGLSIADGGAAAYIDGEAARYGSVTVRRDEKDPSRPWKLHSTDRQVDMEFTPCAVRSAMHSALIVACGHQVYFGFCSGIIKKDGAVFVADRIPCCAGAFTGREP